MNIDWLTSATYTELVDFMRAEPADSEFFRNIDASKQFWDALETRIRSRLLDDAPLVREHMGWNHCE